MEGCVNARARDYARALVKGRDGTHNYRNKSFPNDEPRDSIDHVPFSNIEIGQLYEYQFKMLPIAYTWGKGHKMKILIRVLYVKTRISSMNRRDLLKVVQRRKK